ncbi:hypothetical protein TNCV_3632791 [Trichonephila clavipes]|nr:hypothetical protein TNCV_3632791 [Trichonephila clavipes]
MKAQSPGRKRVFPPKNRDGVYFQNVSVWSGRVYLEEGRRKNQKKKREGKKESSQEEGSRSGMPGENKNEKKKMEERRIPEVENGGKLSVHTTSGSCDRRMRGRGR